MFNNLQKTDIKLTGLNILQTCFLNLFLNKGIMFASFHSKGTIPSCSDMINTCASGVLICSTVYFSIFGVLYTLYIVNFASYYFWGYNILYIVNFASYYFWGYK